MRRTMLYTANELKKWSSDSLINGKWIPARPIRLVNFMDRLTVSWGVFTGKYDAIDWQEGGEHE